MKRNTGLSSFLRQEHARRLSGVQLPVRGRCTLPDPQVKLAAKCANQKCFRCHGTGLRKGGRSLSLCPCAEGRMLEVQQALEEQERRIKEALVHAVRPEDVK